MRVILSGQRAFGAAILELLQARGDSVLGVYVPQGVSDPLDMRARSADIRVFQAGSLRAAAIPEGCDLIIGAHSHDFISEKARLKARYGAIGYHPSLLPLHRGRDAVRWAVRDRDRVTGGSVYWMNNTVDGGPIAAQDWCFIRPGDTAKALWQRELFPMGVRLMAQVLSDLDKGVVKMKKQDTELATWEPAMLGAPRLYRPELEAIPYYTFGVIKENGTG